MSAMLETIAESGFVPAPLLRLGIRRLLRARLAAEERGGPEARRARLAALVAAMRASPIAVATAQANRQHYELPPEFFGLVLGARRKYSGCLWDDGVATLDAAEERALALSAARAEVADGQDVLDLGCGWGSFSLFAAERHPRARILAVSNSGPQGEFLRAEATRRGLANVAAATADANGFSPGRSFDRVVSIEMFEHLRNPEAMLARIATWLRPGGKLFLHLFCHRRLAYWFETDGRSDWMARHFFTGGVMPSEDLLPRFQRDLRLEERWFWNGTHYARTAAAWRENLEAHRAEVLALFRDLYGTRAALRRLERWRLFFLACEELFAFRGGSEWGVAHYRFVKP